MYRLISLVNAGACLALAQLPLAFWPQVAILPPGTNPTQRTEVVPGVPSGITAVLPAGVVGVPVPAQQQQQPSSAPIGGAGVPSIVMGGSPPARGGSGPDAAGAGAGTPLTLSDQCDVTLIVAQSTVGPHGGAVDVPTNPLPAHCRPNVGASGTWLQFASTGVQPGVYRFSAAPNTEPVTRTANIVIGNRVFTVRQEGLITTRLAATPAKLALGLHPKYAEHRRQLTLWADKPGVTLAVTTSAPWLRVNAARSRKSESRLFEVIVDSTKLPQGVRHEAAVLVTAAGAPPLAVPVVAERISSR
jgi:hypothetical protein